jgi:hypothetical protein
LEGSAKASSTRQGSAKTKEHSAKASSTLQGSATARST